MKNIFKNYINTFKGLSIEIWWLSLITLINRAGTVVFLFLSLYLTKELGFSKGQVGWVFTCYGFGSVLGAWIGGKLTDKIGYYKVMSVSLAITGISFVLLQFVSTFEFFCLSMFLLVLIADTFRPASYVALNAYSKPENRTRSLTLLRLAINLGFSLGPAIAGIIVSSFNYRGLFWMDGLTCFVASLLLLNVLNPKKAKISVQQEVEHPIKATSDKIYMLFLFGMLFFAVVFLQYFSTMPLYYREVYSLTELQIGLLMGLNGLFIFVFEMPLIKWIEDKNFSKIDFILFGSILLVLSILVLNFMFWVGVLIIGMLLMTIGEMVAFPISNAFAVQRAQKGKQGDFMAMYTISFSLAHIVSHNVGMQLTEKVGFTNTWYVFSGVAFLCSLILFVVKFQLKNEK